MQKRVHYCLLLLFFVLIRIVSTSYLWEPSIDNPIPIKPLSSFNLAFGGNGTDVVVVIVYISVSGAVKSNSMNTTVTTAWSAPRVLHDTTTAQSPCVAYGGNTFMALWFTSSGAYYSLSADGQHWLSATLKEKPSLGRVTLGYTSGQFVGSWPHDKHFHTGSYSFNSRTFTVGTPFTGIELVSGLSNSCALIVETQPTSLNLLSLPLLKWPKPNEAAAIGSIRASALPQNPFLFFDSNRNVFALFWYEGNILYSSTIDSSCSIIYNKTQITDYEGRVDELSVSVNDSGTYSTAALAYSSSSWYIKTTIGIDNPEISFIPLDFNCTSSVSISPLLNTWIVCWVDCFNLINCATWIYKPPSGNCEEMSVWLDFICINEKWQSLGNVIVNNTETWDKVIQINGDLIVTGDVSILSSFVVTGNVIVKANASFGDKGKIEGNLSLFETSIITVTPLSNLSVIHCAHISGTLVINADNNNFQTSYFNNATSEEEPVVPLHFNCSDGSFDKIIDVNANDQLSSCQKRVSSMDTSQGSLIVKFNVIDTCNEEMQYWIFILIGLVLVVTMIIAIVLLRTPLRNYFFPYRDYPQEFFHSSDGVTEEVF